MAVKLFEKEYPESRYYDKMIGSGKAKTFCLETDNTSYVIEIIEGYVNNAYWGEKLSHPEETDVFRHYIYSESARISPFRHKEEYPAYGGRFYSNEALKITFPDGVRDTSLRYDSYEITDKGLILTLKDDFYPLKVKLYYDIYEDLDLIDRYAEIINGCEGDISLETFYSANWILPFNDNLRLTYMGSGILHEYDIKQTDIGKKTALLESKAGSASLSRNVPYFAVDDYTATENSGKVYFGTLQWSGNWQIKAGVNEAGQCGVVGGISNFDSEITLSKGESFLTPVFTGGFVTDGFGEASRRFHDYIRKTAENRFTNSPMPVLYNAWSTFGFNVSEKLIREQAKRCADLGVELLVIDDGWMKDRKDDKAGLGDWEVDKEKFPNGLKPVVDYVNSLGIKFGIWVEPEMVNPDSDLYRAHPDWVINYPTRERSETRNQLTLNIAREDVYEYTEKWLDKLLSSANIEHLKWDMNRYISEAGFDIAEGRRQREIWVKYTQNLYRLFKHVNDKFPHVLIENCASGGTRADLSLAKWCPRINRSDNQDPIDVLSLHEGFTRINLPKSAGGGCHFHHTPNYVNGRSLSYKFMAHCAFNGSFAIGLDLNRLTDKEFEEIKGYVNFYKEIRETVQLGDMYVLSSSFDRDNKAVIFEYVSKDKSDAVIFVFANNIGFQNILPPICPKGLDADKLYSVTAHYCEGWKGSFSDASGDTLMKNGIFRECTPFKSAYGDAFTLRLTEKK